jgi:hypothetical protein
MHPTTEQRNERGVSNPHLLSLLMSITNKLYHTLFIVVNLFFIVETISNYLYIFVVLCSFIVVTFNDYQWHIIILKHISTLYYFQVRKGIETKLETSIPTNAD